MSLSGHAFKIGRLTRGEKRQPELMESILSRTLRRLGLETRLKELRILLVWDEVVGREIARRTKAIDFRDSKVFVEVRSATWRNQLVFLKPQIIDKLNVTMGRPMVEDIVFIGGQRRKKG